MRKYLIFIVIFSFIIWLAISIFNQWRAEIFLYHAQSLNDSITQSLNHPITQSLNHPFSQSLNHLITQSLNHYNTSISLNPSKSEYHYRLAKFYEDRASKKGISIKERIKWFEKEKNELIKAIELEPTNTIHHLMLGWVYYYLFVYDKKIEYKRIAEKEFRLAYNLYPTNRYIEAYVIKYLTRLNSSIAQ